MCICYFLGFYIAVISTPLFKFLKVVLIQLEIRFSKCKDSFFFFFFFMVLWCLAQSSANQEYADGLSEGSRYQGADTYFIFIQSLKHSRGALKMQSLQDFQG